MKSIPVDEKDRIRAKNLIKLLNNQDKMQFTFKGAGDIIIAHDCLAWIQSISDRVEESLSRPTELSPEPVKVEEEDPFIVNKGQVKKMSAKKTKKKASKKKASRRRKAPDVVKEETKV